MHVQMRTSIHACIINNVTCKSKTGRGGRHQDSIVFVCMCVAVTITTSMEDENRPLNVYL